MIWLLSKPACAETNRAMQKLMGVKSNSGEQNKDISKARQKWDAKDTLVILTTFADRDPFSADSNLRNIMTGVNADNAVNVDRVRAVGEEILSSMTGKSATDYTFKRGSQAVTLAAKSSVRSESDTVQVDPQLLLLPATGQMIYRVCSATNCAVIQWLCSILL